MKTVQVIDARFVPIAVSVWLSAAVTVLVGLQRSLVIATLSGGFIFCLFALTFSRIRKYHWQRPDSIRLVVASCILGFLLAASRLFPILSSPIIALANQHSRVQLTAIVSSDPIATEKLDGQDWHSSTQTSVRLKVLTIEHAGQLWRLSAPILLFADQNPSDFAQLVPGATVSVEAKLFPPRVGSAYVAYSEALSPPIVVTGPPHYQWWASLVRVKLSSALVNVPSDAKALIPGLTLGDTRNLTKDLNTSMRSAGLTHLVSVSGANVTILLSLVFLVLARTSRSTRFIVAILTLASFVVLVRPQPSVLRAAAMGFVMLFAFVLQRKTAAINVLAVSVAVLVVIDPLLSATFGFALSVLATAGLLIWSKPVGQKLSAALPNSIPQWLVDGIVVTICAQLAVLPILILLGAKISLVAIPANLLAVPLAGYVMISGLILTCLALVWLPLAQILAWLVAVPAQGIAQIAKLATRATLLELPLPIGIFGAVFAVILVALLICAFRFWNFGDQDRRNLVVAMLVLVALFVWTRPSVSLKNWPPRKWQVIVCDVGQGDATVIKIAKGQAIVIDAGPDPNLVDSCLRDLGIKNIPLLVLTHFHADHVAGLSGVFKHRRVGEVRVTTFSEPFITSKYVFNILADKKVLTKKLVAGDQLQVAQVSIKCIWPAKLILGQGSDANNSSLVLQVKSHGLTMVFAGDVEAPAQRAIRQYSMLTEIDVLKVAHHGSRNQDEQFAQLLRPRIGVISVGANNTYGHPAHETLLLYELLGTRIFRTDTNGAIAIWKSAGSLEVLTAR